MTEQKSSDSWSHFAWGLVWWHVDNAINYTNTDNYRILDEMKKKVECFLFFENEILPPMIYYFVPLTCFGVIGNFLSLLTFMTTKLRNLSSSHYLTGLAIADTGVLLYIVAHNYALQDFSPVMCPFTAYCGGCFCFLSAWFVVCFTIERFIAVRYPLKRPRLCTVRRARFVLVSFFVFAAIFNLYLPAVYRSTTFPDNSFQCSVPFEYSEAFNTMALIDAVLVFIIPLIFIFFCNLMIIYTISYSKPVSDSRSVSNASETGDSIALRAVNGSTTRNSHRHPRRRLVGSKKITIVLLVISFVYILCNFPVLVVRLILNFDWNFLSSSEVCWIISARIITLPLYGANYAVNFVLYCLVGSSFREHFIALLRRNRGSVF